ncbi:MAG: hypothetical protein NC191_00615 [Muribaculaceae bacterium]|nr:hypothetical protein [Muribaculaceae bacterium]
MARAEWNELVQARAALRASEQKVKAAANLFYASAVTSRSSRQESKTDSGSIQFDEKALRDEPTLIDSGSEPGMTKNNYIVVILRALARKNPADSSKSWIASHSLAMTTLLQCYCHPERY